MRALYRQQQTPEEMQNVRDIIQHSPGTMSLTKQQLDVDTVTYADAVPHRIDWFSLEGPV